MTYGTFNKSEILKIANEKIERLNNVIQNFDILFDTPFTATVGIFRKKEQTLKRSRYWTYNEYTDAHYRRRKRLQNLINFITQSTECTLSVEDFKVITDEVKPIIMDEHDWYKGIPFDEEDGIDACPTYYRHSAAV